MISISGRDPPIFPCHGLIDTVGIAAHGVTAGGEGPRPATAADRLEFANTTFSFKRLVIPQLHKNIRASVDIRESLRSNVAADQVQKTAGLHVASV